MSEELKEFLQWWLKRAETATQGSSVCCYGLCANAVLFFAGHEDESPLEELMALFKSQGLHRDFPFGRGDYLDRLANKTLHECPKRLAWVKAQLTKE